MAGYGSDMEFQGWLASQGLTLPADAPVPAVLRQIGADYLDAAYEAQLQCSVRAGGFDQERAWPRIGHTVRGQAVTGIPNAWVLASYRAAWLEASSPGWATGSVDPTRRTKREKVDVIEREFFAPGDTTGGGSVPLGPVDATIQGMVSGLLCAPAFVGFRVI